MTPEFERHIAETQQYIKWRKARPLLEIDLAEHLESAYEHGISAGLDHQGAVQAALDEVGPPAEIGPEFNKAFRPAHAWEVMLIILFFSAGGLFMSWLSGAGTASLAGHVAAYVLAFAVGYKIDCRVLAEHQKAVYGSFLGLLSAAALLELLHIVQRITPYVFALFPLVFCGTANNYIVSGRPAGIGQCILCYLLPAAICMAGGDLSQAIPTLLACAIILYIVLDRVNAGANRAKLLLGVGSGAAAAIGIILACAFLLPGLSLGSLDPSGFFLRHGELRAELSGVGFLGFGRLAGSPEFYLEGDALVLYIARVFGGLGLLVVLISMFLMFYFTANRIGITVSRFCALIASAVLSQIIIASLLYLLGNLGVGLLSTCMGFPFLTPGVPAMAALFFAGAMLGATRDGFVLYD